MVALAALVNQAMRCSGRWPFRPESEAIAGNRGAAWPSPNGKAGRRHGRNAAAVASHASTVRRSVRDRFRPAPSIPSPAPRALGLVAQDQQRNAQRRCFFLHPPLSLKHQVGAAHRFDRCRWDSGGISRTPACRRAVVMRSAIFGLGGGHWPRCCRGKGRSRSAIPSRPAPQFSRRWQVTSRVKACQGHRRRGLAGTWPTSCASASIPLLPVTWMRPARGHGGRLAALPLVGANNRSANRSMATRFSSSGHGRLGS